MFAYLLGGKIEKYQPKGIFVFDLCIMSDDYAVTGNWLYGQEPGGSHTLRETVLGKGHFFPAKSFLCTTKVGNPSIFIHPAAAAWFVAQILERIFMFLYLRNLNRNRLRRASFDLTHFKVGIKH